MFMSCGYYIFAMTGRLTRLPVAMQIIIEGNIIVVIYTSGVLNPCSSDIGGKISKITRLLQMYTFCWFVAIFLVLSCGEYSIER